jgi:hypothetical protein
MGLKEMSEWCNKPSSSMHGGEFLDNLGKPSASQIGLHLMEIVMPFYELYV